VIFAAAHRYRRPEWDSAKNEEVFGLCARESFHGHTYTCDVTITGPIDPKTGFVVNLGVLDGMLDTIVRQPLDHRNLNVDVPEFAEGRAIPTSEKPRAMDRRACAGFVGASGEGHASECVRRA